MKRLGAWIISLTTMAAPVWAQHYPFLPVPASPHGIYTMFQDSRSALWLGTIDDAVEFDGEHFYSLRQYGFPKEIPDSFAEDSDGGIWIATQGSDFQGGTGRGGLYRYEAGHLVKIMSGDGMSVAALAPGIMLASLGTELNDKPSYGDLTILRRSKDGWTSELMVQKQAGHLTVDHQGNVEFPCPGGWCAVIRQQLLAWQGPRGQLSIQRHSGSPLIERVLQDRFGCMWFRAEAFASYQCPTDMQPQIIPASVSQYDSSAHLEETADGSIFMLVLLALGRPGSFQTATTKNGLPNNLDTALVAKDGTIWIGTETGLVRFMHPFQIESWGKEDGIGVPFSIARDGEDILAASGGILKLGKDRKRWNPIAGSDNLTGNVAPGPNRTILVANSFSITQLRATGGVVSRLTIPANVDSSMAASQNGDVWFGHGGISRITSAGNRLMVHPEKPLDGRIQDIRYDDDHRALWACNGNDLVFLKDGAWGRIMQKDGLPNLLCDAIAIEPNGDLWVGHDGGANSWISNPASGHPIVQNYFPWRSQLVNNNYTYSLAIDRRGWLWLAKDVLNFSTLDAAKNSDWLRLDEQDGVSRPAVTHSFQEAQDGSVWFGTASGITHFSPPDNFATNFPSPPIFVAGLSLGQSIPTLADASRPIPRNTEVVAHIGSLQFDRRNALQIRYRLLPQQTTWTIGSGLDISMGRLSWGPHTLQVQARMATGEWSSIVEQSLPMMWPIWLTWPALLLYAASGSGLTFASIRWNKYRRRMRDLPLPDLSAWRIEAMSPETEHLIGTVVDGRYEIGHILSVGGFATVVRARDLHSDGALCAVKIFRFELGDQDWVRHRFQHEVMALEQLSHPNIVKITGHGTVDTGAPYLVMEFIHGRSLRELLELGSLSREKIAKFLGQIASALARLHRCSIYHRDIKPENLMLRQDTNGDEQFVLIDFSIAIVKSPDQTFHGISRVAGTLGYMAPEQVTGYADASTDIHSLAKVVIEMLTGQRCADLLPEATLDIPVHVRAYFTKNPGIFEQDSINLIAAALAFDPSHRPHDVQQFAAPIIRDLQGGAKPAV